MWFFKCLQKSDKRENANKFITHRIHLSHEHIDNLKNILSTKNQYMRNHVKVMCLNE